MRVTISSTILIKALALLGGFTGDASAQIQGYLYGGGGYSAVDSPGACVPRVGSQLRDLGNFELATRGKYWGISAVPITNIHYSQFQPPSDFFAPAPLNKAHSGHWVVRLQGIPNPLLFAVPKGSENPTLRTYIFTCSGVTYKLSVWIRRETPKVPDTGCDMQLYFAGKEHLLVHQGVATEGWYQYVSYIQAPLGTWPPLHDSGYEVKFVGLCNRPSSGSAVQIDDVAITYDPNDRAPPSWVPAVPLVETRLYTVSNSYTTATITLTRTVAPATATAATGA